jgi:N-terminal domain on NACHT_NTPase and P-loop NTPases
LHRLDEFQPSLVEIPKSFRHIKAELPVLRDTLQQTREAIDAGSVTDKTKTALIPAIQGCMEQIESLHIILAEMLPTQDDSRLERGKKEILSLRQDSKVESITKILHGYIGTLTFLLHSYIIGITTYDKYNFEINKKRNITWWAPPYRV